jgi:hypothetical protein
MLLMSWATMPHNAAALRNQHTQHPHISPGTLRHMPATTAAALPAAAAASKQTHAWSQEHNLLYQKLHSHLRHFVHFCFLMQRPKHAAHTRSVSPPNAASLPNQHRVLLQLPAARAQQKHTWVRSNSTTCVFKDFILTCATRRTFASS